MAPFEENTVGADEAASSFSEWLERAERGEEITITRKGDPVARLIPVRKVPTRGDRREVIRRIRELSDRLRLDGLNIKDLIAEGRR